jgi:O-acetyl-ADP-ribose deacetylase (regulator of RNase III)
MPSSTPQTRPCWVGAAWTAPSIAPPDLSCVQPAPSLTAGFNLPARHVIHTVGPVWGGGTRDEDRLLALCYANSLDLALAHDLTSIAFPAISTGIFGFPPPRAARIAIATVLDSLRNEPSIRRAVFCCFGKESRDDHETALAALSQGK